MAEIVYRRDGYPVALPDDVGGFIVSPDAMAAWVAEDHGTIVGHVALHPDGSDPVMSLAASALAQPRDALAVVARLLVSPTHRRQGVAASLLASATAAAWAAGRRPVLDVATHFADAVRLYEALGWTRLGRVSVDIGETDLVDEFVFSGPPPGEATAK